MSMSHDDIVLLLPFLANGTLEGDELSQVQAAVDQDASLASKLAALKSIRETMQNQDAGFSPGEMGLARLLRDVGEETPQAPPKQRSRIWQVAAALLLAVSLGQAYLLTEDNKAGTGFELAGETSAMFTIAVHPNTTEAELRALLLEAGVEIISGPSSLGLYGLSLLEGTTRETAQSHLESATDIIETLELAQ